MEMDEETKEVTSKKRIRDEEKEENETLRAKSKCVSLVSAEASDFFSQGDDWESCGGVSLVDLLVEPESWAGVCAVADVTVVLVSPSSVVTECFGYVSWDSDWELC